MTPQTVAYITKSLNEIVFWLFCFNLKAEDAVKLWRNGAVMVMKLAMVLTIKEVLMVKVL
jgi:hypothetical protein